MNHIPAQVGPQGAQTALTNLPAADLPPGAATVCIRPEAVRQDGKGIALGDATVRDATFFGTYTRAHVTPVTAPDMVLVAHLPPTSLPEAGTVLNLSVLPEDIRIFTKETA
nr:TOBE domain-containing protein [Marivita geojedonensis]